MEDNVIAVSPEESVASAVGTLDPISKTEMEIEKLKEQLARKEDKLKKQKKKKREEEEKKRIAFERELGVMLDAYLTEKYGETYTACRTADNAHKLLHGEVTMEVKEETA